MSTDLNSLKSGWYILWNARTHWLPSDAPTDAARDEHLKRWQRDMQKYAGIQSEVTAHWFDDITEQIEHYRRIRQEYEDEVRNAPPEVAEDRQ